LNLTTPVASLIANKNRIIFRCGYIAVMGCLSMLITDYSAAMTEKAFLDVWNVPACDMKLCGGEET
jgi:hypothetical protein